MRVGVWPAYLLASKKRVGLGCPARDRDLPYALGGLTLLAIVIFSVIAACRVSCAGKRQPQHIGPPLFRPSLDNARSMLVFLCFRAATRRFFPAGSVLLKCFVLEMLCV